MLIHRDAFTVHEITTAEEARYFINGALIDEVGRTVATNGHVLVRFTSDPLPTDSFPAIDGLDVSIAKEAIVSREDLKAALATLPKVGSGIVGRGYVAIVPNGKSVTIATATGDRTVQITARNVEATFPKYAEILVAKKPVSGTVVLDAAYLEALGRMARQVGARSVTFTLHNDPNEVHVVSPVLFTAKGEHGTLDGAIMPMRT